MTIQSAAIQSSIGSDERSIHARNGRRATIAITSSAIGIVDE
jgi:hypothetical protein